MNPRLTLSLGKACVAGAAMVFAFDVLDSMFLFIVGSHTLDFASGRTVPLNFLKGFRLYVTPAQHALFIGTLALAAVLFLLGVYFYARLRREARGVSDIREERR